MYKSCRIFGSLHQIGMNGIFHQYGYRSCNTQIFHRKRITVHRVTQQNIFDTAAQVALVLSQTKNGHQFRCSRNIESRLLWNSICRTVQSGHDMTQIPIIDIQHTLPQCFFKLLPRPPYTINIIIQQCRNGIVRCSYGMKIAREVKIDIFHWQYLSITASCCTSFHAKHGTKRRLTQYHDCFFPHSV